MRDLGWGHRAPLSHPHAPILAPLQQCPELATGGQRRAALRRTWPRLGTEGTRPTGRSPGETAAAAAGQTQPRTVLEPAGFEAPALKGRVPHPGPVAASWSPPPPAGWEPRTRTSLPAAATASSPTCSDMSPVGSRRPP